MIWPWKGKREERADATDALIAALQGRAEGGDVQEPSGLAAVEMASGLVGRAFAGALVSGDRLGVVTPQVLELVGRSIIRRGELVLALDDGPRLLPASGWEIRGMGPDSKLWTYRLNFDGPSGLTHSTFLLAGSVIHIRINCDSARCWVGRAPWSIASSTARTAASAEASAAAEASIPSARIAPHSIRRRSTARRLQAGFDQGRHHRSPGSRPASLIGRRRARTSAKMDPSRDETRTFRRASSSPARIGCRYSRRMWDSNCSFRWVGRFVQARSISAIYIRFFGTMGETGDGRASRKAFEPRSPDFVRGFTWG